MTHQATKAQLPRESVTILSIALVAYAAYRGMSVERAAGEFVDAPDNDRAKALWLKVARAIAEHLGIAA